MQNKGEANHPGTQQGEGGHAVAGFPEVFHQRKFGIGIRPDEVAVHFQILAGHFQVFAGQAFVRCAQEGIHGYGPHLALVFGERSGHQVHFFHGMGAFPADNPVFVANGVNGAPPLGYHIPFPGKADSEVKRKQFIPKPGNPVGSACQIHTGGVYNPGGGAEGAFVFFRHGLNRVVDCPLVFQYNRCRGSAGPLQAVQLQLGRAGNFKSFRRDAEIRCTGFPLYRMKLHPRCFHCYGQVLVQ